MQASAVDRWLLAAGISLWVVILLVVAIVTVRLVRRAKQYRRLRAALEADAARVAAEFEAAHPGSRSEPVLRSTALAPASPPPAATPRSIGGQIRGMFDMLVEAAALPPEAVPRSVEELRIDGLSHGDIERYAPCVTSPRGDPSAEGRGVTCSICLEEIEPFTTQRVLPCLHVRFLSRASLGGCAHTAPAPC
jgi:hypothetical protein